MTNQENISQETLNQIGTGFQNLDAQRVAGLANAASLIDVNNTALSSEQKRLTAKYGADSPRVKDISAKLASSVLVRKSLDLEIIRASEKTAPFPGESVGILQGRVLNTSNDPLPNTTVFIADEQMQTLSVNAVACSSTSGFYSISIDKDMAEKLKSNTYYVKASNADKKIIYSDTTPFAVITGKRMGKNIIISDKSCTPPPTSPTDNSNIK